MVTGYAKSKHDTTSSSSTEKKNDITDDNSNNETSCEELSDKKDIACSMYTNNSCLSLMIAGFISGLGTGIINSLTRWDIVPLRKNLSSLSHNQHQKTVWGMVRVKIFALRNEILSAMTIIVNTMNNNADLSNEHSYLTIEKRIQLSNFYARELLSAVKEGMTIRTLRAYLELLEALAFPWVTSTESSSFLSISSYFCIDNYSGAHDTSHLLQEVLSYVDSSQSGIFKTLINVMMMYATRLDGLLKCEEIAINIIFSNITATSASDNIAIDSTDNNKDEVESDDNVANCDITKGARKIAASSSAADTILGEVFKYIDGILRDEINRKLQSVSSWHFNKQSADRTTIREICNKICKLAFRLLDYTNKNADENDMKNPLLLLLSDKRKNQVLALFSRIISRCIKETALLQKVMQQCQLKNIKKENYEDEIWNNSSDDDEDVNDDKKTNDIKVNFDSTINSVDFLIAIIVGISSASFEAAKDIITDTINYRPVTPNRKAASAVIKRAHALGFKVEELQWRLLHLLQELSKQKKNNTNFERDIATIDSELCIPFLSEGLNIIDSAGHDMLQSILQTHENDDSKNLKNSKKRRKLNQKAVDDDIDIDDEESIEYDEDDDEEDDEDDEDDDDNSIDLDSKNNRPKANKFSIRNTAALLSSASSRKAKTKRMRSRNRVIDEWLDIEDGDDTYADLEDFVMNG